MRTSQGKTSTRCGNISVSMNRCLKSTYLLNYSFSLAETQRKNRVQLYFEMTSELRACQWRVRDSVTVALRRADVYSG